MTGTERRKEIAALCHHLKTLTNLEELREADQGLQNVLVKIWSSDDKYLPDEDLILDAAQEISRRIIHMEIGDEYDSKQKGTHEPF